MDVDYTGPSFPGDTVYLHAGTTGNVYDRYELTR